jgi:uncharacterized protein YaiI (UPF0178 family)
LTIWVDADACPNSVKDVLYRAAERARLQLTLVANAQLSVPRSKWIKTLRVPGGFDVADDHIVAQVQAGDLVITADIPLAAAVIERGAAALNPRGEAYDRETIKQKLVMRDLMDQLRGSGIQSGGPPPLDNTDKKRFADALDRWLALQQKQAR